MAGKDLDKNGARIMKKLAVVFSKKVVYSLKTGINPVQKVRYLHQRRQFKS
jgi:hypothetical protein